MKKLFLFISAAAIPVLSCDRLLEEEKFGALTEDELLKKPENIVRLVGQAYADVKWLHDHWGYWGLNALTTDECICPVRQPGNHWSDGGYWGNMNNHNWNAEDDAFENVWNTNVSGAVLCNKIIKTLDENYAKNVIPEAQYRQYKGEVEVLRSYYFYMLFDSFGRIPYTEEFSDNDVPLMEPPQVWQALTACIKRNAPNMETASAANYGRVTQGFAYALLARLYLNAYSYDVAQTMEAHPYDSCIAYCDKIISSGVYSIEEDFFTNFKVKNEASKENIFVIVEDGRGNFDSRSNGSMSNKLRIAMLTLHYNHQQAWNMKEKPWNGFCATPEFIALYDPMDKRGTGSGYETNGTLNTGTYGWFIGQVYDKDGNALRDENGNEANITTQVRTSVSGSVSNWADGARLIKYEIDKNGEYQYCENDFVLMRYADVLYMKAEAQLRTGAAVNYSEDLSKIRTRAGVEEYSAGNPLTLQEIIKERGREFAWENVRRRDLIRFDADNIANTGYVKGRWIGKATDDRGTHYKWFPIPAPILRKAKIGADGNPIWRQTQGY